MSSLKETCGDGRFITPPAASLVKEGLLHLTPDRWAELCRRRRMRRGTDTVLLKFRRYTEIRRMETTIHAHVPSTAGLTHNSFFDESYNSLTGTKQQLRPSMQTCPEAVTSNTCLLRNTLSTGAITMYWKP